MVSIDRGANIQDNCFRRAAFEFYVLPLIFKSVHCIPQLILPHFNFVHRTLYDIGVLCAEITAHFRGLSSQWITAVKALCCLAGSADIGYIELHDEIDVRLYTLYKLNFLINY